MTEAQTPETAARGPEGDAGRSDPQGGAPGATEAGSAASGAPESAPAGSEGGEWFSPAYVAQLRDEAASNRVARTQAEARAALLSEEALRSATELATSGVLRSPESLPEGDYLGDDGLPDHEKIRAAALEVAEASPHLAVARVPVHGMQGPNGQQPAEPVSLGGMLRDAAR